MTPEAIQQWIAEMKATGLAQTRAGCARKLGVHPNSLKRWADRGLSCRRTALAMRAILHRMDPWG